MQIDAQQASLITEGWLVKQSKWIKVWRKRYAFLYDTTLYLSVSRDSHKPKHVIDLLQIVHVKPADEISKQKNSFLLGLKSGEKFYFRVNSDEDRNMWIQRIERVLSDPPKRMTAEQLRDQQIVVKDDLQFYLSSNLDRKIEILNATAEQKIILRSPEYRNCQFKVSASSPGFILFSVRKGDGELVFLEADGMFGSSLH